MNLCRNLILIDCHPVNWYPFYLVVREDVFQTTQTSVFFGMERCSESFYDKR